MNRISNINSSVIDEMIRISRFVQLIIKENKIDELSTLFQDINQEIILQRNNGAKELDFNNATFKLEDYPKLSKFIFDKYETIIEEEKFFTNRDHKFLVIREMILSVLEEDRFGVICWLLTTVSMELLHNRKIIKKEFSFPDYLIPETDKIDAHENLLHRFQQGLDQPQINDDECH
jgi:hypothetical protein